MKRKLQEYFEDNITISKQNGKPNIVVLNSSMPTILHDSFMASTSSCNDNDDIELAKIIEEKINSALQSVHQSDSYPVPADINKVHLQLKTSAILKQLVTSIFTALRTELVLSKQEIYQLSICHAMMQSAGKFSYISPLLLSIGLLIYQWTRSKVIIEILSSFGFCASYEQITAFEKSSAVTDFSSIQSVRSENDFIQWVADNFDLNEDTGTGHDTTHVMGII